MWPVFRPQYYIQTPAEAVAVWYLQEMTTENCKLIEEAPKRLPSGIYTRNRGEFEIIYKVQPSGCRLVFT